MGAFLGYGGIFLQLCGIAFVGLCLVSGISVGDYGKIELIQFIGGMVLFYGGHFLKRWSR